MTKEIAIDLGTANTIIITDGQIAVEEPSVVAIRKSDDKMMAVGRKAAAMTDLKEPPQDMEIIGPNKTTDLPLKVNVTYKEIAQCLEKNITNIETAILQALGQTPSELYADIVRNGIYLTGGGALLNGLAERLTQKMTIAFHVADDPLHSVAKGTGVALKNLNKLSFLIHGC